MGTIRETVDQLRRRVRRFTREAFRENSWLLSLLGAAAGILLAAIVGRFGRDPDPETWTVTVDRARDTLIGGLGIIFASLSIVLALASVTAQNVVGRYSSRVLRVQLRRSSTRTVIAFYAMAASFIIAEQVQLRSFPPDEPAPVAGVAMSLAFLILAGVAMIW